MTSKAGELVRRSVKIYNLSKRPQKFNIRTVDWSYSPDGQITYYDDLQKQSCRPWVKLERLRVNVVPDPLKPRNFRFEVQVPPETADIECRFAIMIENLDSSYEAKLGGGSITLPVTGRIAVIVYLGVGGVKPVIEMRDVSSKDVNGRRLPVVEIFNSGNAHGRLSADLSAKDSAGKKTSLSIATSPIMPNQSRLMTLSPDGAEPLKYPLSISGRIYSDDDTFPVDANVSAK